MAEFFSRKSSEESGGDGNRPMEMLVRLLKVHVKMFPFLSPKRIYSQLEHAWRECQEV